MIDKNKRVQSKIGITRAPPVLVILFPKCTYEKFDTNINKIIYIISSIFGYEEKIDSNISTCNITHNTQWKLLTTVIMCVWIYERR